MSEATRCGASSTGDGYLASITDALDRTTTFGYTNRCLTSVTTPLGQTSTATCNGAGQRLSVTDPLGHTTNFTWSNDDLAAITDALGQAESWTYDSMDRVASHTDRRNRTTSYGYDALGRPSSATLPGAGGTLTASYDAGNRLMVLSDSLSGTLNWSYDGFDQVTQANGPQGSIVYGYDAVGRRTSMQAATQTKVNYAYDDGDRLTGIAQGSDTVSFAYDNANRLSSKTLPNQVQTVYVYNDANQVTGLAWGKAGQTALGSLGYGYDSRGQLVAQTGSHAPQALPPASTKNSFDDNNRQTQANGNARSYDADGHLLSDGTRTYTWDDRDHLSQITQGGTVIASYSYDALGRRTAKTETGATTQYLYDGLNTVQETQGTTINPILTGPGIDERYARDDNGGRTYFLTDALGSTRLLTDTNGNAVQRYDYDPYGATTQSSTSYSNPYQYTGREHDQSGLYYYRARYYTPELGRFVSEDPLQLAAGPNSYAYVGGNPVSYIDPYGLRDVDVYIWRAEGFSVGHVMVTEAGSTQVILSQFPGNGLPVGPNETKSFPDTLDAEGRSASEVWRINVPNDAAFDAAAARERALEYWTASPSNESTQCSIAASRALRAGGVKLNTITTGTLMPGFFANGLQATPGVGVRIH